MSKITDYLKKPTAISSKNDNLLLNDKKEGTQQSVLLPVSLDSEPSLQNEVPVQCQPSADYSFPSKVFGKKNRSCQASWFRTFSWLHYS